MINIFATETNERILQQNLDRIQQKLLVQSVAYTYDMAWFQTARTVDLEVLAAASDELAKWQIACNSHDISKIAEALHLSNRVFYDCDGIEEAGIADYIALHKTATGVQTPYVHTIHLSRMERKKKAYPFFLRGDKVCIGRHPVTDGWIDDFDPTTVSFLSNSGEDKFATITKVLKNEEPLLHRFSASYCLQSIDRRLDELRMLGNHKGFKITTSKQGSADAPVCIIAFEHETDAQQRCSYAFYFREACVRTPHINGINTGTFHGPKSLFFAGPAKELLEDTQYVNYPKITG